MQERAQKILLLSAAAVRSRICTSGKDCGALSVLRPAGSELDLQGYGYLCVALVRTRRQSGLQGGGLADSGPGSLEKGIGRE